eukprot:12027343-Alexandrium_andersonii.AAC.1
MRAAGYAVQREAYTSSDFMLPQGRTRAWAVILDKAYFGLDAPRAAEKVFDRLFELVDPFKCKMEP